MGHNICSTSPTDYNSQSFFREQVDLYRWRADPLTNANICRVMLMGSQNAKDKDKLRQFIQQSIHHQGNVSLNQIIQLINQSQNDCKEMISFENYYCTLDKFQESLNIGQIIYCLQVLLCGYETIFSKFRKCVVQNRFCFITSEGQIRAWVNSNTKLNQLAQESSNNRASVLLSEIQVIRRIMDIVEVLAANHTQFLHLSRHCRCFMDRDILQNWNFETIRKLINNYALNYRIVVANNLSRVLNRKIVFQPQPVLIVPQRPIVVHQAPVTFKPQVYANENQPFVIKQRIPSPNTQSRHHQRDQSLKEQFYGYQRQPTLKQQEIINQNNFFNTNKLDFVSTGDTFMKNNYKSTPHSSKKQDQRSQSFSQNSNQGQHQLFKQFENVSGSLKRDTSHKLSLSTHVKFNYQKPNQNIKFEQVQSSPYKETQTRTKTRNGKNSQYSSAACKLNRSATYAQLNHSTTLQFNQSCIKQQPLNFSDLSLNLQQNSSLLKQAPLKFRQIQSKKMNGTSILKNSQHFKQRKKLSKKVATISKYTPSYLNQSSNSSFHEKQSSYKTPQPQPQHHRQSRQILLQLQSKIKQTITGMPANQLQLVKMPISTPSQTPYQTPTNQQISKQNNSHVYPKTCGNSLNSFNGSENSYGNLYPPKCFTAMAIDKLLDNSDIVLQNSEGTIKSIPQSEKSSYFGVLTQMGRSVDVINIPSNKVILEKRISNNQLRSFAAS